MHNRKAGGEAGAPSGVSLVLQARPERHLIRRGGSHRHIDFAIKVHQCRKPREPTPLTLALVIDRSGSMAGGKLATAKRAALAVLDRLEESDHAAVVVFDNCVDLLQPAETVTPLVKGRVRAALGRIEARATTALHEGWLTGCRAIAGDEVPGSGQGLARCFLLTDGLANVGLTDPEAIASQAAGIRQNAGIGTSTFGIGADYNEGLLGPLAVAGGGQFHHLRTAEEIAHTFVGELGELLAVVAGLVRLELQLDPGVTAEAVSAYRATPSQGGSLSIPVGDLLAGEERHVVMRFAFPPQGDRDAQAVRARLVWSDGGVEHSTAWQEVPFSYADGQACDSEARDPEVMHWVGLHHAERARQEAASRSRRGDLDGARTTLQAVSRRIARYAGTDPDLRQAVHGLRAFEREVAEAPLSSMRAKEVTSQSQRRSRGQRDLRSRPSSPDDDSSRASAGAAGRLVGRYIRSSVDWPAALSATPSPAELLDLYRGCLLWGAVGDALGRPAEGRDPATLRARYGPEGLQEYVPSKRRQGGPRGRITDDTQLTMEVARSLLSSGGNLDPEDLARRLVAWLPVGRGVGRATRKAVQALAQGVPWWEAGLAVDSAGNGAAMRAAPVGLAWALAPTPAQLQRDAVLSALPTHTHPVGVAGAVVIACGVACCVGSALSRRGRFDVQGFVDLVAGAIAGMEPAPSRERRPGGAAIRLSERIRELPELLERPSPEEVFRYTYNGAFALESVPAALYCFLRSPDDPRQVILTAVNAGYDADSVASMAGNLAGAWCGAERLEREAATWYAGLEYRQELIDLADGLARLAIGGYEE